jgi:hypothetical protein
MTTAAEINSWSLASLADLREALFAAASVGSDDLFVYDQKLEFPALAIVAGRLLDAGCISDQMLSPQLLVQTNKARAGLFRPPHPVLPIVFSGAFDGGEAAVLIVARIVPGDAATVALSMYDAKLDLTGQVRLLPVGLSAPSAERREVVEHAVTQIYEAIRFLQHTCKAAVETVTHRSGVTYSRLDVDKAVRLLEADDATPEFAAVGGSRRPLTEGPPTGRGDDSAFVRARRALLDGDEEVACRISRESFIALSEARAETRRGRLFAFKDIRSMSESSRSWEAFDAIRSGLLHAPYPVTFLLLEDFILKIEDRGFVADPTQNYGFKFTTIVCLPASQNHGVLEWWGHSLGPSFVDVEKKGSYLFLRNMGSSRSL